jgi:hypothetical protein
MIEPDDELLQAMSLPDWSPPDALGAQTLDPFRQQGRLCLATAVNLMAFGQPEVPDPERVINIARRQRAAKRLFDGARRGQVSLVGDNRPGGDRSDPIPADYFDMPRKLGHDDNTIDTDLDAVSFPSDFIAAREKRHLGWFSVRVNGREFIDWLSRLIPNRAALATAPRETAAIKALKAKLEDEPQMKRDEARQFLSANGLEVSGRGFQLRVWPKARDLAGLPIRAPSGRKRKSSS